MKVSYEDDLANCFAPQRSGVLGDRFVLSVRAKGKCRPGIELRSHHFRVPILS